MTIYRFCGRDFHLDPPTACRCGAAVLNCRGWSVKRCTGLKWAWPVEKTCRRASPWLLSEVEGLRMRPAPRCPRPKIPRYTPSGAEAASPTSSPDLNATELSTGRTNRFASLERVYPALPLHLGHKPLPGDNCATSFTPPLLFGAAAWLCAPRDQYIGWNHSQRQLTPLSSTTLVSSSYPGYLIWRGTSRQDTPKPLEQVYGYCPVLLETFVEKPRFQELVIKLPVGAIWESRKAVVTRSGGKTERTHQRLMGFSPGQAFSQNV